jgi:putative peptidoglycan lipid II flippase
MFDGVDYRRKYATLGEPMKPAVEKSGMASPRRFTTWRMLADTVTVGGWTTVAKVAGAVKLIFAARLFGAGDAMDAYLIAFLLPSFFIDMFAGPLDSALIPTLIEVREKRGKEAAEQLYRATLGAAGAGLLIAAAVVAAASALLLPLVASSFPPAKLAYTQRLLLLMIAVVPLSGLASTWRAVLNSEHQFAYSAAVPAVTPLVSIVALVTAGKQYSVLALAVATLTGGTLEAILAGAGVKRLGYAIVPRWAGISPAMRQVATQYAPLVAITLVMTGSALVDQSLAARLGSGSVAALSYGTRLLGVLVVIGPTAMGTAVLPHISAIAVQAEPATLRRIFRSYALFVLAVILPVTVAFIYFSEPIIRVLFQKGAFDAATTHLVSTVQRAALLQLPIAVLLALEIRLSSARKANRLLYRVAALSLVLTIVLDLLFMRWWGVVGIALAGLGTRLVSGLYLSCKFASRSPASTGIAANDRVS